eukprot:IDg12484t1
MGGEAAAQPEGAFSRDHRQRQVPQVLQLDTPKIQKLKTADVLAYLDSINISYAQGIKATDFKALANAYINANVNAQVVSFAESAEHRVVFPPPHYSGLQPIELVCAIVKRKVGHQFQKGNTFRKVKDRLDLEFAH